MNSIFKKTFNIFLLALIILLCVGIVSAADINDDSYSVNEDCIDSPGLEKISMTEDDFLESTIKPSGNTFDDIQNSISNAKENDVIELDGIYKSSNKQLNLNKSLTIQGSSNRATLDFNNDDVCLYVSCCEEIYDEDGYVEEEVYKPLNVVFKNLDFINARGAIFSENSNVTLINCNFRNNNIPFDDYGGGGAIQTNNFESDFMLKVYDSNFENCSGYLAGAILADNAVIRNSTFTNNYAMNGGAVSASNLTVSNSKFNNNKAQSNGFGGAILVEYGVLRVDNSEFNNNRADGLGSAILVGTPDDLDASQVALNLTNSKFGGNVANYNVIQNDLKYADKGAGAVVVDAYETQPKYSISNCTGLNQTFAKTQITLSAAKVSTTYNSGKTFSVKVVNKNTKKAIKNCQVRITIVKSYTGDYYAKTNSKGIATFKLTGIKPGTYKVNVVTYMKYSPAKTTSTVKISKAPTIVKAPKVTAKYKKSKYFKVTVKSKATKKVVKNIKVKIKVYTGKKYKTFTVKTNKKGIAKLNTKKLKKGSHKVLISSGNSNYKISAKSTIKIMIK